MRKTIYLSGLFAFLVLVSSLSNTSVVQAGERTDIIDTPEILIKLTATFDDIYYRDTQKGQITIRVEISRLVYKVYLTDLYVALESLDRNPSYYTAFTNPVWLTLWRGMEFTSPAIQSWVFTPTSDITLPSDQDMAWMHVFMKMRIYKASGDNYYFWWETVREEATILVHDDPSPRTTTSSLLVTTLTETRISTEVSTVTEKETLTTSIRSAENTSFVPGFTWVSVVVGIPLLLWLRRRRA